MARWKRVFLVLLSQNIAQADLIASNTSSCSSCCTALSSALPSLVFTPDGSVYQSILSTLWTQQAQALKPSCFVQPMTSDDVSTTIRILREFNRHETRGATQESNHENNGGCQFAIKSGGHTPFSGAANIDHGVTIDLSRLNRIEIQPNAHTASIGSGNRWGNVYSTLQSEGYTVPGGRDSNVGVGGLVLGGGVSFFSPRVGLVCDSVTNFELVLASGAIVNANSSSNSDLFRALKGGSNNFGVVTKIDLPLLDPGMWGGFLYTDTALRQTASTFFHSFADSKAYDPNAALIQSNVFVNGSWLLVLQMTYTQPNVSNPAVFEPLLSLPGQSTVRQTTHLNLTNELAAGIPANPRGLWVTMTMKNDAEFMETVFQLGNATATSIADVQGVFVALSFQPLPQTIIQRAGTNGGDALGLDGSDGDLVIVNLGVFWQDKADDDRVNSASWGFLQSATAKAKEIGLWNEYIYLNYALRYSHFVQKVLDSYGPESLRLMHAVSAKYDPTALFQKAVPGGFKLQSYSHSR